MTQRTLMRIGLAVANVAFATLGFGVGVCVLSFWTAATHAVQEKFTSIYLPAVVIGLALGMVSTVIMAIAPMFPEKRRDRR